MNSRAVQEPEAWFACNGGYFRDTQDLKGGLVITFRGHTGSSGYLLMNSDSTSFRLGIEESEGTAELTATCRGVTHTYSVTLDEWHTVIWAPVNKVFKIDGTDLGFSGSVQNINAVALRFCSGATDIDIATISKWNTYTDDEAAYDRNFVPQMDGRYYDTVNRQYFSITGSAPDYYTPETDPWKPTPVPTTGWLEYSQSAGTGTTQITLTAPEYTDIVQRTTSLRIEGANGTVIYATVVQEAIEKEAILDQPVMDLVEGSYKNGISSNVPWYIPEPIPSWIEISPLSGGIGHTDLTVTVEYYEGTRSGSVKFCATDNQQIAIMTVNTSDGVDEGYVLKYTTNDNSMVDIFEPSSLPQIVSHTYKAGQGRIVFQEPVTEIGDSAFMREDGSSGSYLTSVTLPPTVETIANRGFYGQSQLTEVVWNEGLKTIGTDSFHNCPLNQEDELTLPESLETIESRAFCGSSFTSLVLGSNIKEIGVDGTSSMDRCFPSTLNKITINATTTPEVGKYTFYGVERSGILYYLPATDYSSWLSENEFYLGYYDWNGVENAPYIYFEFIDEIGDIIYLTRGGIPSINFSIDKNDWNYDPSQKLSKIVYIKGTQIYAILSDDSAYKIGGDITTLRSSQGSDNNLYSALFSKWRWHNGVEAYEENTKLINAEKISFANVNIGESYDFNNMFRNCTSLTTAPVLPSGVGINAERMFYGCTSLTGFSQTLSGGNYLGMFLGCTSLTTAPELPDTEIGFGCYRYMFSRCTSLTTAPELPATTLTQYCYEWMFNECTSLTTAPELPATTLVQCCYRNMFRNCTSLTTAPELPATTLLQYCYKEMFSGCTSLNYLKMNALENVNSSTVGGMLNNVSPTGTLVIPAAATYSDEDLRTWTGMPSGWTIQRQ